MNTWSAFKPKPCKSGESPVPAHNFLPTNRVELVPKSIETYYSMRYMCMQIARGDVVEMERVWNEVSVYSIYEYMILQRQYNANNSIL